MLSLVSLTLFSEHLSLFASVPVQGRAMFRTPGLISGMFFWGIFVSSVPSATVVQFYVQLCNISVLSSGKISFLFADVLKQYWLFCSYLIVFCCLPVHFTFCEQIISSDRCYFFCVSLALLIRLTQITVYFRIWKVCFQECWQKRSVITLQVWKSGSQSTMLSKGRRWEVKEIHQLSQKFDSQTQKHWEETCWS